MEGGRARVPYLGLIVVVLWVGCLVDAICAEEHQVRHLPKVVWLLVVIAVPLLGSVLWLVFGRPVGVGGPRPVPSTSTFPEYDRPGRQVGQHTESDEEFLRRCRDRAEEQRRIARERRRREEGDGHS